MTPFCFTHLVTSTNPLKLAPSLACGPFTLYQLPKIGSLADALQPFADLQSAIASLAALAAERYVASPNFTVLHMITGMRALRVLSPWIESEEGVQPILIRAFTAAYLAARLVPLATAPEPRLSTWPEVTSAAIASEDDHVIKLVHACREEASLYGEGPYLRIACLAVG